MEMNIDDMSTETIEKYLEARKKEKDYTLLDYTEVKFSEGGHDLIFGNGAKVQASGRGDGVFIQKKYVHQVTARGEFIEVVLKGSTNSVVADVIWSDKNGN